MSMELDIEDFDALRRYLKRYAGRGEPVSFERLKGGVSNRVVKVTWADGHGWVVKQALTKLRVTVDWFSSPETIVVEARALRWLNRLAPKGTTPSLTFEDAGAHLMAMEAIPIDHENWKSVSMSGRVISDHFEQFGSLLGTVHRKSAESGPELRSCICGHFVFRQPAAGTVLSLRGPANSRSREFSGDIGRGNAPPQTQPGSRRLQS
jgi:hypothetical protein